MKVKNEVKRILSVRQNYLKYIIFLYFPLGNLPIGNKIFLFEQTTQDGLDHQKI